ncbi:MAG: hypothetical protein K9J25_06490 [Bacteroidales bacterium]|nr:hypothetical protein [Bacteroidales bacterium]
MPGTSIDKLQIVANGLGELIEEMVFVGGTVAELYADNPEISDIRPTDDVDCVIELGSTRDHDDLEADLREKGFIHDTSPGAPVCRKIYTNIKVDIMPSNPDILGFSNEWYTGGIENKIIKTLPDDTDIYVFSPEYYLAAKFEAHNDRGGDDLRQSYDFEDIIYIFHNYSGILDDIENANNDVKEYLIGQCETLLNSDNLIEGIESALPYGSDSDSTEKIKKLIKVISEIE